MHSVRGKNLSVRTPEQFIPVLFKGQLYIIRHYDRQWFHSVDQCQTCDYQSSWLVQIEERLLEAVANKYITYTSNTINHNHGNPFLAVWGFPDDSVVKNLPAVQEMQALYWGGEETWRRKWQPLQCSCLGSPMDRGSLAGYSLWGHKESDMT